MLPSLFCSLFWFLFSCATLNGGTETPQSEPNVTKKAERWDETDTKPFEQNKNQTLAHTHTLTDPPAHQITEHTRTRTTLQTDLLSGEEPFSSDPCQDIDLQNHPYESPETKPLLTECVRDHQGKENCTTSQQEHQCPYLREYSCFIDLSNKFNCSWTSDKLPDGSKYSTSVIACNEKAISTIDCVGDNIGGGTQSGAMVSCSRAVDVDADSLIFRVKVSTPYISCLYNTMFSKRNIVLPSPPPNLRVRRVIGGDLLVQWDIPYSPETSSPICFKYELFINNQERRFEARLNYTEPNADVSLAYQVKIRTQPSSNCHEVHHWSAWSTFEVPACASSQLEPLVVIGIALGIPMVLLALLMLLRPQRVSKLLFPPIPQPPKKIRLLLERQDLFQFVPTHLSKCVDDITIVEEADETPEKDPVTSW